MHRTTLFFILLFTTALSAQSVPTDNVNSIKVYAPVSTVVITPAEGNELTYSHEVMINDVLQPEITELKIDRLDDQLMIEEIHPVMADFSREHKRRRKGNVTTQSYLRIQVPTGLRVDVETKFGSISCDNVAGLISARSTYGSVDVIADSGTRRRSLDLYSNYGTVDLTLPATTRANLTLQTDYGALFTDMDIAIDKEASRKGDFSEKVVATINGGGEKVACEAPYGKVYLRSK